MNLRKCAALFVAGLAALGLGSVARASSHSDAPLIKQDPQANLTDVFTFVGTDKNGVKVLNVIVNVHPFCEPGDGAIYDRFADDALYTILIGNPTNGSSSIRYDFKFSAIDASGYKNVNTILSYGLGTEVGPIQHVGDNRQNYTQTYTVTRQYNKTTTNITAGVTPMCPPPNVGLNTTPYYNDANGQAVSGATTYAALDRYTAEASYSLSGGETVFCGSRDDGFFADAPGVFDLINSRILKTDHMGVDGFKGYNVLTYAIQIPVSQLQGLSTYPNVGVFATVSRPAVRLLNTNPTSRVTGNGNWVQVNRLANPLFNEVLVATKDKDNYNYHVPFNDAANFKTYANTPELAHLLNVLYNVGAVETGRTDLVGIYIPDVIKVDLSTPPVPLPGQAGFNRLSFIGGDTVTNAAGKTVSSGWPNGRRIGDDVVDIALTAVVSGPTFAKVTILGDNVDANDATFNTVFPYEATPNSGTLNHKDSQ